jgi:hypothetical protein
VAKAVAEGCAMLLPMLGMVKAAAEEGCAVLLLLLLLL